MVFPSDHPLHQDRQGALLCGDWPGPSNWRGSIPAEFYLSADDVGKAEVQGLLTFHYSAFSAGWPMWDQWQEPNLISRQAQLARLPLRLLEYGTLAVVGFTSRTPVSTSEGAGPYRALEFIEGAVGRLFERQPIGSAMESFG